MKIDGVSRVEFRDREFTYDGRPYPYTSIISVVFEATITRHSVNFVPAGKSYDAALHLVLSGVPPILAIKSDAGFFGGMKQSGLEGLWRAKEIFSEFTFVRRVERMERELESKNYFSYSPVQFHKDGDLFDRGVRLFNILDGSVTAGILPHELSFQSQHKTGFMGLMRPRPFILDIKRDRDCLLFMLHKMYRYTFQNEPLREKRINNQMAFYEAVLVLGARLAAADGSVDARELEIVKSHFNITSDVLPNAGTIFNESLHSSEPVEALARRIAQSVNGNDAKFFILLGLAKVASSDGRLHPAEHSILLQVSNGFELDSSVLRQILALVGFDVPEGDRRSSGERREQEVGTLAHHLRVLGLKSGVSIEDVRIAFRLMVKRYHPDTLRSQGLPEREILRSEEILKTITVSYAFLKKHYGFS